MTNIEIEILSTLRDFPMTRAEITKAIKAEDNKIGNLLEKLKKSGDVELTQGKKWQLREKGAKRLGREKEVKDEKSALTKTEKEGIAIKRYNAGLHPRKIAEEIKDVDLTIQVQEKLKELDKDEYSKCLNLLEKKSYIDTKRHSYTPGPVWYGIDELLIKISKLENKVSDGEDENIKLRNQNTGLGSEVEGYKAKNQELSRYISSLNSERDKWMRRYKQLWEGRKIFDEFAKSFSNDDECLSYIRTNLRQDRIKEDFTGEIERLESREAIVVENVRKIEEEKIKEQTELEDISQRVHEKARELDLMEKKYDEIVGDMAVVEEFRKVAEFGRDLKIIRSIFA